MHDDADLPDQCTYMQISNNELTHFTELSTVTAAASGVTAAEKQKSNTYHETVANPTS